MLLSFSSAPSATEGALLEVPDKSLRVWLLPEVTYPEENPNHKAVENLGKQLFFDPRLTGERTLACAACHYPGTGWSDPLSSKNRESQTMDRNTPALINTAFQKRFFWDGRGMTLEDAIKTHLKELSVKAADSAPALPSAYRQKFQQAFGSSTITPDNIARAIANFLRTVIVNDSPFDRWISGDKSAISQSAKKGFLLFTGKARCAECHSAPNFSDSAFHNTGINSLDPGHFDVTGDPQDRNRFRTASLRQASRTPPYMHNGSKKSLMHVIEFYSHGGDRHGAGNELSALNLNEQEEHDLLDFLMSLTGSDTSIAVPQLPLNDFP
ncbi:MAG: cytochrome c peroxidase [Mariprofundaceae bacterium]|nr:cytochrome c peroxidase [Mariprofundaceae bacterium]